MRKRNYTDYHADDNAEIDDTRIVVEETATSLDIIRERYCLVKYDDGERWFDWHPDESFRVRADNIGQLTEGIQSCDTERMLEEYNRLRAVDEALAGGSDE